MGPLPGHTKTTKWLKTATSFEMVDLNGWRTKVVCKHKGREIEAIRCVPSPDTIFVFVDGLLQATGETIEEALNLGKCHIDSEVIEVLHG